MITYSIIQKSQLEGAKRLDAEYYQPEYLALRKKLFSSPILDKISKKITDFGAYSQMNFVEYTESGVRFLRNQDIGEFFIENSEPIYISNDIYKKLNLKLEEHDIVTPRVGTLGNAAVVFKEYLPASANQNLAQIKPDIEKIDPVYLSVFLNSKFGHFQFDQFATGNVQPWLNLSQIKSIKVFVSPRDFQESVKILALQALQERNDSKSLYSQAEKLLLEELGLTNFSAKGGSASGGEAESGLWSVVKLSDVKKANRIDAEYFQPRHQKLYSLIRANGGIALGELATIKKGFEPGSEAYQEEGKLFIRVSSISRDGITDKDQKYLKDELYQKLKKDYEPKVGEILLTKDASPGMAFVVREPIVGIISGGVLRVKLREDIEPEYLALVINSLVGQSQVERDAGGSIIMHWKPDQVKALQIPILSKAIQQEITELVRKSHETRKKAKELLESAKQKVENLIEQQR
ncbi:MAG: restriction endonuclease subunit S [Patescibacteria group bacterium]